MKNICKLVYVLLCVVLILCTLNGCNKQVVDLTYNYKYAIISLPDGRIVEGNVQSWSDYEDGDQIQVKIDGATYLVHSSNCVLMTSNTLIKNLEKG